MKRKTVNLSKHESGTPPGKSDNRKKGRPESRILKIDASPEYAARAMFAAGKVKSKKSTES